MVWLVRVIQIPDGPCGSDSPGGSDGPGGSYGPGGQDSQGGLGGPLVRVVTDWSVWSFWGVGLQKNNIYNFQVLKDGFPNDAVFFVVFFLFFCCFFVFL